MRILECTTISFYMEFGHIYYLFKANIAHIIGEPKTMSTLRPKKTLTLSSWRLDLLGGKPEALLLR
jgi:hypothetical protein